MNVFVSYQHADVPFAAHALGYALRAAGHTAFVDTGSIGAGALYRQVISNAVAASGVLFALTGPAFALARLHEPTSVVAFEWQRARFHGVAVVPVLVDGAVMPADAALPPTLRWFTRSNALALRRDSLAADIDACILAVPGLAAAPHRAARVLWVDDRPANNERERKWLRPHGIVFDNVVSTDEAVEQLVAESYDLVITDLGRQGSSDRSGSAGAAFLGHPALRAGGPPVVVYAGRWAMAQREGLLLQGAADVVSSPQQLFDAVLGLLGRGPPPAGELAR